MKLNKFISFISASALALTAAAFPVWAADSDDPYIKPVFAEFDENLVNGTLVLTVPEDMTADVTVYFASPEFDEAPYYSASLEKAGKYYFEIEGYDISEDDYRNYFLRIEAKGGKYGISATYFEGFSVPDPNDNPDSYRTMNYVLSLDGEESLLPADASENGTYGKNIMFHLNYVRMGDIDGNTKIDASDASQILQEYSILSTGGSGTFDSRKKIAADVNGDGKTDASDASKVLVYYSVVSTGGDPAGIFTEPADADKE